MKKFSKSENNIKINKKPEKVNWYAEKNYIGT